MHLHATPVVHGGPRNPWYRAGDKLRSLMTMWNSMESDAYHSRTRVTQLIWQGFPVAISLEIRTYLHYL